MNKLTKNLTEMFRAQKNRPMKVKEMAKRLRIPSESYRSFRNNVRDLHREGFLLRVKKGKYALRGMVELVEGRIRVRQSGDAQIQPATEGARRITIPARERRGALNGDGVRVMVTGESPRGDLRGRVVEVVKRAHPRMSGFLTRVKGKFIVVPGNPRIDREIVVTGDRKGAEEGDLVVVAIKDWGKGERFVYGSVCELFGGTSEMDADILSIILEHGLPLDFPPDVEEEAEKIHLDVNDKVVAERVDCRQLTAFTIDPLDAKDHDDALSIERVDGDSWKVGIHIADVSHYVRAGTSLDAESMKRGSSVYLVDRVIPMLPERLSGDICSLKQGVDRLTLSVFALIDGNGIIQGVEILETVIRSRAKLTYDQAQAVIDGVDLLQDDLLTSGIRDLYRLSEALREKRMERGSLDFDRPESYVVLDDEGIPVDIQEVLQLASHRLVEEFMILANEIVTRFLTEKGVPMIFRIHEAPEEDDLEELGEYMQRFRLAPLWRKSGITPETFQQVLKSVKGRKEEAIIVNLLLRSMKRARYSIDNRGHFGLSSEFYTHFTSPIRRYPDLTVHRQLKASIRSDDLPYPGDERDVLREIAEISTECERTANLAEWGSIDLKKVQFMERHLGEIFTGTICGFIPVGFFVILDAFFVEGMVLLRDLDDDYYDFVEELFIIRGRRRGRTFSLGDRVEVKVARTDKLRREIDFLLIDQQ